jgi:3'(2'), 5'-bisphosphate nucleotidase
MRSSRVPNNDHASRVDRIGAPMSALGDQFDRVADVIECLWPTPAATEAPQLAILDVKCRPASAARIAYQQPHDPAVIRYGPTPAVYEDDDRLGLSRSTPGSERAELIPLTPVFHALPAEHLDESGRSASGRALFELQGASELDPTYITVAMVFCSTDHCQNAMMSETDAELATRLAVQAGEVLVQLRAEMFATGSSIWDVRDSGDAAAQHFIAGELHAHRPDDAVLSEEGLEDPRRYDADRVWIIDPLDGTREYGEQGRHDWAVHIALWENEAFGAAAVSLPAVDMVFSTDPAPPMPILDRDRPRLITSRNRAPYAAVLVAEGLGCDAVRLGSAGAKAMAVVMGEADIYVHDGGMYQWDSAAPAAVAMAAGFHASRLDGSPLVYNDRDAWLPDFFVCRPELTEGVLKAMWG